MALPVGLTLVEDKRVKQGTVPAGLTLVEGMGGEEPAPTTQAEQVDTDETFAQLEEGALDGEYSSDTELNQRIAQRGYNRLQIEEAKAKGEVSAPVAGFQKAGQLLGAGFDIAGKELSDTTKGIAGLASAVYDAAPDFYKEAAEGVGSTIGSEVYDLQKKLGVDEVLSKGGRKLTAWWDSLDKQTRRNLHATGLIGSLIPIRQVGAGMGEGLSKVVAPIKTKLVEGLAKERVNDAIDFVRPHLSGRYEREALKRTQKGIYTPTPREKEMGELVMDLKGYKVKGNPVNNKDAVLDALGTRNTKLTADVARYGSEVPPTRLNDIDNAVSQLVKDNADFVGVSEKVPALRIAKVSQMLKSKAAANGGKLTSRGVHEVRKEFDKMIKERSSQAFEAGGKQFDPILNTDMVIRDKLNDIVDATTSVNVSNTRREISSLITVSDNVVRKVQKRHDDVLTGVMDHIGQTARGFWAVKTIGKFAGAGSALGLAAMNPVVAGGIMGALGASYTGYKIAMSRPSRRVLVGMLQGLEQAGKATKNAAELVKIKQSKTALTKIISNIVIREVDQKQQQETKEQQ